MVGHFECKHREEFLKMGQATPGLFFVFSMKLTAKFWLMTAFEQRTSGDHSANTAENGVAIYWIKNYSCR